MTAEIDLIHPRIILTAVIADLIFCDPYNPRQACSQDFLWGSGGGCIPQEPGPNTYCWNDSNARHDMYVCCLHGES